MESWVVTRLNIPSMLFMIPGVRKTGIIGSWSKDILLVSKQITNIENIIIGISIINNLVLPSGRIISVSWIIISSE